MSNSGQCGRFSVFKNIIANTTFQWSVGVIIGIATLIVTIAGVLIALLSYMQDREGGKQDKGLEDPPPQVEYTVPQQYTIAEHQPLFTQEARTNLSVTFQNIEGQEFVSLNIAPEGEKSSVRAALRGYTEKFTSSAGVFHVQILDIDYKKRKVVVQVSRKK
ncbi:hypothetical protein GKODMF_12725 [Candidatus Electrothrix gigas]